jgi:hypothetical protein
MSAFQLLKRWAGGLALRINALVIDGASVNQILVAQSDGHGGVEFLPKNPTVVVTPTHSSRSPPAPRHHRASR